MTLTAAQRQHWRQLWAREAAALEGRRQQLLVVAKAVAKELQGLWPEVGVWLFGSVHGPGFHDGSDLDLAVEGLPREALLEALALAERCADAQLLTLGGSPVAVDLVRLEALPVLWQERIRQRGQALP